MKKWIIYINRHQNSMKDYLIHVSNYQNVHNSLKVLGIVDGYNFGMMRMMHINNLTNEELEIIDLLKNQGVDIPLAWRFDTFFED